MSETIGCPKKFVCVIEERDEIFWAYREAIRRLEQAGFSVGRMQAHAPMGLLFGNFDIQKWRNLNIDLTGGAK